MNFLKLLPSHERPPFMLESTTEQLRYMKMKIAVTNVIKINMLNSLRIRRDASTLLQIICLHTLRLQRYTYRPCRHVITLQPRKHIPTITQWWLEEEIIRDAKYSGMCLFAFIHFGSSQIAKEASWHFGSRETGILNWTLLGTLQLRARC